MIVILSSVLGLILGNSLWDYTRSRFPYRVYEGQDASVKALLTYLSIALCLPSVILLGVGVVVLALAITHLP